MKNKKNDIPQVWTTIGHEIRTPLNVIKGMAEISEKEVYDVELVKDCLSKIRESSFEMQNVVNSLVDYAAIMQENLEITKSKIDVKAIITEVVMQSYYMAKQKSCHFDMHVQDLTEEILLGDGERISQVLLSLVNLVIRNTAKDGVIDFSVQQIGVTNTNVFVRFRLSSTELYLPKDVTDYLEGSLLQINPDLLVPKGVFELFEMNALYISQLMGGKISVENKNDQNCEIIFDMEFGKIEQEYSTYGTKLFAKQKIMIVAEEKRICEERGRMLTDMGMEYDSVIDEKEALDKIGEAENDNNPYTICIIDGGTQNSQFINLIQEIRNVFGHEIIIILIVHNPEGYHKENQNYGANYVIDRTIFRSTLFDAMVSIEKGIQVSNELKKQDNFNFYGSRVLVAEDAILNMEIIIKLLERVKIEVTCAENGLEAVKQFESKPEGYFGAILLDINMPIMDGYEAARTIRKSKKADAAQVPIYAMSANAFKEDIEKSLESGMNGHISKPIDVKVLYSILGQVLKKQYENELNMLRDLAEIDPLTGCLNRRGFEARIREMLKYPTPVVFLVIDVDDFKQINDCFGHSVGDEVLQKIANVLKKKFRINDCFVRLGGDEFAVILVDYKNKPSYIVQRMNEVNEELFNPTDGLPPVTLSVGAIVSEDGYNDELYIGADKALYKSKLYGKGICTVLDPTQEVFENELELQEDLFTDALYYPNKQTKVIVEGNNKIQSALMIRNKPVCFICGFYEEKFPIYSFNGFFPEQLGFTVKEFLEEAQGGFGSLVHRYDAEHLMENKYIDKINNQRIRLRCKNGDYIWFSIDYIIVKTTNHRPFWMASLKNIDDHLVGNLCADDYRLVAVIDSVKDTMVIKKGAYLASDKELNIQKNYNYTELISRVIIKNVKESNRESYLEKASLANVCQKLSSGGVYEFTVYQKWAKSEYGVVRHKYRYTTGDNRYLLCTWEFLGQRAEIDELTDSLNETGFYKLTEEALKIGNKDAQYTILFFDISGFKAWNSMLGRTGADKLLKAVSRCIAQSQLNVLTLGRLNADHFVCLVENSNLNLDIISHICNHKFEIRGNMVQIQMRCGIFTIDNRKEPVRNMCDKAKLAITQISNEHAVPYHYFDDMLNKKYVQHKQVLNQVEYALERKEIKVFYQPIVDSKTQRIVSAEALIRWVTPDGTITSPDLFIPALEERGNIADVDSYVQNTVSAMLERRSLNAEHVVPVSVNVSRMDFLNANFVKNLQKLVLSMDQVKSYMRIEVTESSFTEVGKAGENLIKELRNNGIKILMDDFGTGFSTLSGITSQQFDIIKIDRNFIWGLDKNNGSEAVIQSVITMSHALNLKVVAEGVETEKQYQFLKDAACDYIQGYYFYKPMPENEFEALLNKQ